VPFNGHVVPNLKPVNSHGHEPLIRLSADTGIPAPVGQRARRSIPQDVKIAVSVRDGGRCRQCGSAHQLHFDHVIPVSRGGANTAANVQLLCGSCNRAKSAKLRLTACRVRRRGMECGGELS
jgi:HNH endonuclease